MAKPRTPAHAEKPRDRERTSERILHAAKVAFAKRGYTAASLRDIAEDAGVTAALVVRYFGSKEALFEAAVADAFDLRRAFADVDASALGEALAAPLFGEQGDTDQMAMTLLAAVDPAMNGLVRKLVRKRMHEPMAALVGGEDAEQRAALVLALATGVWVYRFLLPLAPLAGRSNPDAIRRVAALLQCIVDDDR